MNYYWNMYKSIIHSGWDLSEYVKSTKWHNTWNSWEVTSVM